MTPHPLQATTSSHIAAKQHLTEVLQAMCMGALYYALSNSITRDPNGALIAAIIWPAPAVAAALLWRLPYRRWHLLLLTIFLVMLGVGHHNAMAAHVNLAFALLNVLQTGLCAWLGKHYVAPDGKLDTIVRLSRFLILLPLCAIALTAIIGATIATLSIGTSWRIEFAHLMVGNGVAVLIVMPALLAWYPCDSKQALALRWSHAIGALFAVVILLLWLIPGVIGEIIGVLLSLLLVGTAITSGMQGLSLAVLSTAITSIALTSLHKGPYDSSGLGSIWRLQLDLAGMAVLSFFVAIALRERERMAHRLEQARHFESLGMLASGIAHDFRNILSAIGGYAEIADECGKQTQAAQQALHEVRSGVKRGGDLIEQILLAARRGDRQRTTLDLRQVARESITLATPLCPRHVSIALHLPEQPLPVLGHYDQLVRAILNLINNATQAARTQVTVTLDHAAHVSVDHVVVGSIAPGGYVWINVDDDGAGIANPDLAQLFEPFYSSTSGGTGLGLAIVAGVAAEHNGAVALQTYHSGPYSGSNFRLLLPHSAAPITPHQAYPRGRPSPTIRASRSERWRR